MKETWICPICDKENEIENMVCLNCKFDQSTDYETFPTLHANISTRVKTIPILKNEYKRDDKANSSDNSSNLPKIIIALTVAVVIGVFVISWILIQNKTNQKNCIDQRNDTDQKIIEVINSETMAEIEGESDNSSKITNLEIDEETLASIAEMYRSDLYDGPYNTNEITLYTDLKALIMSYNNKEMDLGVLSYTHDMVDVYLVNYDSKKIVNKIYGAVGGIHVIKNIPEGKYYYVAVSEGYNLLMSKRLIVLTNDSEKEKDILDLHEYLESDNASFGNSFQVKVVDSDGHILQNIVVDIGVKGMGIHEGVCDDLTISLMTNSDGYLTMNQDIDTNEYDDPINFRLLEGYGLQMRDSTGFFQDVQIDDANIGTAVY